MASKQSSSSKILTVVITVAFALIAGVIAYATWKGGSFQLRSKAASEETTLKQWTFDKSMEDWQAADWKSAAAKDGKLVLVVGDKFQESSQERDCSGQARNNERCRTRNVTRLFDPRIETSQDVTLSSPFNRIKVSGSITPPSGQGGGMIARRDISRIGTTVRVLYKINNRKNFEAPIEMRVNTNGSVHEAVADFPRNMSLRKITDLRISFGDLRTYAGWGVNVDSVTITGRATELVLQARPYHPPETPRNPSGGGCKVTGCSGQICASEDIAIKQGASICVWKRQYACYRAATCEKQKDGNCAWTVTDTLDACLESFSVNKDKGCHIYCPPNSSCNEKCPDD